MDGTPPPVDAPPPRGPYAPLRHTPYRWYIAGLLLLTLGLQVQSTTLFWQVFQLTADPLSLGLVGLAGVLPSLAIGLFAGHVADRVDRRRVVLRSCGGLLACAAALLWLSTLPAEAGLVWWIYGVVAAAGVGRTFLNAARSALGAELVPRAEFAAAVSLRTAVSQVGLVTGPALGGMLIALDGGGCVAAYTGTAALLVAGVICIARIVRQAPPPAPSSEPLLESLQVGLRFVWRDRALLAAMSLDLFAVLFGGAMALLPAFATEVLAAGPEAYGWLRAAPSVGAVTMAIAMAHLPPLRRAGPTMLWSVAAFGACWIGFAFSRDLTLSLLLLVGTGAFDYISVVVRQTLVQTRTPQHLLGRVSAVSMIFIGSSNELGAFQAGWMGRVLGLVPAVAVGGAITLATVAAVAWRSPQLRKLRRVDELPKAEPERKPE